jgi:hypothetical protein
MSDGKTIELRYPRPQRDAEDFIRMIQYEEARLNFIEKIKGPIAFVPQLKKLSPPEIVNRFYQTTLENEQQWTDVRKLLPKEFLRITPKRGVKPAEIKLVEMAPPMITAEDAVAAQELLPAAGCLVRARGNRSERRRQTRP